MMTYLPQTNEALNPYIGHRNSNHGKDSGHHWPPDAAVIRGSANNLILSLSSLYSQPIKAEGVTITAQLCARFTSPFVGFREFGLEVGN